MYRPYISPAVIAAQARTQADTARQAEWLENAIIDGPLPTHAPRETSLIEALAIANRSGNLLSFTHKFDTEWSPCKYPSTTTSLCEVFIQPSGFKNLHERSLPLCPHNANPRHTEYECCMRPRSHRCNSETIVYLQVPAAHHQCSFISIIRPHERCVLFCDEIKPKVKGEDNDRIALLTPPLTQRTSRPRSSKRDTAKGQILGKPPRRLQRHHALLSIPGPSAGDSRSHSPSRGILPGRPIVIDLEDNDDAPPAYSSSPTPLRPQPRRLGAASISTIIGFTLPRRRARTWSAILNCWRSHFHTATGSPKGSNTTNYSGSLTAPTGAPSDNRFPTRLRPYSSDGPLTTRIADAGRVGPHVITKFIFALATTDGVIGRSYTNFMDMLRVCVGCGGHFTPPAFNEPPVTPESLVLETVAYGEYLRPHAFAVGRHPAHPHSAPYREYGYLTALGIALSLSTPSSASPNIFQVVRLGLVPCPDCCIIRISPTATAIAAVTSDPEIPPFIAVSTDTVAQIGHTAAAAVHCHNTSSSSSTSTQLPPLPPFSNKPLHPDNCHGGLQAFLQQRVHVHHALRTALRNLSTCDLRTITHAQAEVTRCRRLVLAVSGDVPTSSNKEVGRTSLFTFGRVSQVPHQAAANSSAADNSSDDAEYYSTSSTSSSGSSNRDLEAKAALWCEYLQHPADVVSRFAPIAPVSPLAARVQPRGFGPRSATATGSPQGGQQERLSRWFAAKRAEEAGAEADDETRWKSIERVTYLCFSWEYARMRGGDDPTW
ncbi:hypothetical protein B0H13DRAFT_2673091 [Mycena leptocephala]|nr:hypothetical protein B0H13DRAFT_2673091 [Mycena leptocephala]